MTLKIFFACLFAIGLSLMSGCAQLPVNSGGIITPSNPNVTKEALWEQRQRLLNNVPAWNLKSKVAFRFGEENGSFGLNWSQNSIQYYVMQITNPITGGLVAQLSRDKTGVNLLSDDGKTYKDTDEEILLKKQAGISLPIKGMKSWVRGLSSSLYAIEDLKLDALGRPQRLQQAGWTIDYSRYLSSDTKAMPGRVVITREKENVSLKMIAKQWKGI